MTEIMGKPPINPLIMVLIPIPVRSLFKSVLRLYGSILSTAFVYLVCLYYFRSKSSNKLIKFFVYEGMGIGTISFFIVSFILATSSVITISDKQKIFIYFLIFFPLIIYGFINAKKVSVKQLKFSHLKIKKNLALERFQTDIFNTRHLIKIRQRCKKSKKDVGSLVTKLVSTNRFKNLYWGQLFNFCLRFLFFPQNFTPRDAHCISDKTSRDVPN